MTALTAFHLEPGEGLVCDLPSGTVSEARLESSLPPAQGLDCLRASSGLAEVVRQVTEPGPEEMARTVAPFLACVPAVGSVEPPRSPQRRCRGDLSGG